MLQQTLKRSFACVGIALTLVMLSACSNGEGKVDDGVDDKTSQDVKPKADSAPKAVEIAGVRNLHKVGDVYLAGQPNADGLRALRDAGVKTVIDLRTPAESRGFDETGTCGELGLTYINAPFRVPDTLEDSVFDRVRDALTDPKSGPVLLHCGSANRVGGVWIAHRVLDGGLTYEQALAEAKVIGLRTQGYADKARDYIARQQKP